MKKTQRPLRSIVSNLLVVVLTLAGAGTACAQDDAWKPDTRVADFQFNIPNDWKRVKTQGEIRLVPSDLASGSIAYIGFLPAESLTTTLPVWFDAKLRDWQRQFRVVDRLEATPGKSPQGYALLRTYTRISSSSLGFGSFVFGAVQVGGRVESYFFVSNADRMSYLDDLESFEHSLMFGTESVAQSGKTADSAPGHGHRAGLQGVYVGYRGRDITLVEKAHLEWLVFFPDGNAIRFLPEEGLEHFDFRKTLKSSRDYCGRYRVSGNRIAITWGDNSKETAMKKKDELNIDGDSYVHVGRSDSLRLEGTFRREGADLAKKYFRFTADGGFTENGMLDLVAYSGSNTAAGSGTYRIANNTITLSYRDGRTVPLSFVVMPFDAAQDHPKAILVDTYVLVRDK